MNFTSEYHLLWLLGCVILAGLLTLFSYFKNPSVQSLPSFWLKVAASVRFLAVFLLAALLLGFYVQTTEEEKEKPTLVFAFDQSTSISEQESDTSIQKLYADYERIKNQLSSDFRIQEVGFGDEAYLGLQPKFTQSYTNYSNLLDFLDLSYAKTNLAGVVVLSDGLFNHGINPLYKSTSITAPIYTVGLGDSSVHRDVFIHDVQHNSVVFKENAFPVLVDLRARGIAQENVEVSILKDGVEISKKQIQLQKQKTVSFTLLAKESGVQAYQIEVAPIEGEQTIVNNKTTIFIEVPESKKKITLLADFPHPDVKALRSTLESKVDYEVSVGLTSNLPIGLAGQDLILVFTGDGGKVEAVNEAIEGSNTSLCYVIQPMINHDDWNALGLGVKIDGVSGSEQEVFGSWNQEFTKFSVSDELKNALKSWSPLNISFGKYIARGGVEIVVNQTVNGINTRAPLFGYERLKNRKVGYLMGEGFWRWRMLSYRSTGSFETFDELLGKFMRTLITKEDKSNFRLHYKNLVSENEAFKIEAEVFNDAYELTTQFPVFVELTDSLGSVSNYELLANNNRFSLNLGKLKPGEYTISATGGEHQELEKKGKVVVSEITIESFQTQANFSLLKEWSKQTNGLFIQKNALETIPSILEERDDIATIIHTKEEQSSLLRNWWPFLVVLVLLAAEWFIRRWQGSY